MFSQKNKLSRSEFAEVYKSREIHNSEYFSSRSQEAKNFKIGIVVPKKFARNIVQRNSLKRLIKKVVAQHKISDFGMKIIVILKKSAKEVDSKELEYDLAILLDQIRL